MGTPLCEQLTIVAGKDRLVQTKKNFSKVGQWKVCKGTLYMINGSQYKPDPRVESTKRQTTVVVQYV